MSPEFTKVKLSSDEDQQKAMMEWIEHNCVGDYAIFSEHNHVFLKDERDCAWYDLVFK